MAGHSKWSKVKHIKGPLDVKRGAQFSKLVKEITVAACLGGGNLSGNPRLRSVVETARAANMPKDNIEHAIKKGTGEIGRTRYEETLYEAYAPGGVAMVIAAATDNKNRTAADLRFILSKNGGSLAASGSVLHMFPVDRFYAVAEALHVGKIEADSQKYPYLTDHTAPIHDEATAAQVLWLYETLEDNDDTQNVYPNFDIPEEVLSRLPA